MLETTWQAVVELWIQGGWLMIPLAALALAIYISCFELYYYLAQFRLRVNPEQAEAWLERPEGPPGEWARLLAFARDGATHSREVRRRFEEVRASYLPRLDRRVQFLAVLVAAAPLTGLFGTVLGMLATFRGISLGGAAPTADLVAGGISQALITTQTGLVIAIPGFVLLALVRRRRLVFEGLLAHLESRILQQFEDGNAKEAAA